MTRPSISFFGSSLVSAYWNGAATYYRGIVRALNALGYGVTFYEPDAYERQAHRDIADPPWARVIVYEATQSEVERALDEGCRADVVIKTSGVGVFDDVLDADLAFLGNRLPDREARVETFFFEAARRLNGHRFLLGGNGWNGKAMSSNVVYAGHVFTRDHNAFNCTPRAVLNVSRESMARYGFSPATRVFEAAGAGACLITDAWEGLEQFLEPGREVLVAHDGEEVAAQAGDSRRPGRARSGPRLVRGSCANTRMPTV